MTAAGMTVLMLWTELEHSFWPAAAHEQLPHEAALLYETGCT